MKTKTAATFRFQTKVHQPKGKAGVRIPVPREVLGDDSRSALVIEGTMEGFPFRAPLENDGDGGAFLLLSEPLQAAIGAKVGDTVSVEITRIGDEPEVLVPEDLFAALAAHPSEMALWQDITPMARREWVRWIASAKQEATRVKRIGVGIDKLSQGMRRPCCFPGINWVTRDLVGPEETWATLPKG